MELYLKFIFTYMKSKQRWKIVFIGNNRLEKQLIDRKVVFLFVILVCYNDVISIVNGYISSHMIPYNDKCFPLFIWTQ